MKTTAVAFLTFFILNLLIPGSSADADRNGTQTAPTTPVSVTMTTATEAPHSKSSATPNQTQSVVTTVDNTGSAKNDTSSATPPPPPPSSPRVTSHAQTDQPRQFSTTPSPNNSTPSPTSEPSSYKLTLFLILLAILVVLMCVGCIHGMWGRRSGEDSSAPRLLLDVRQRLRTAVGNLEDRLGFRLWPGGKRGEEDDEEEAEGEEGARTDGGGEGKDKRGEHKEDDSDESGDSTGPAEDNRTEAAPSRGEEEERKQNGSEDESETSSESEGDQSAAEDVRGGEERGGSEEIALVNPLQEDEDKADLCDVTVL